MTFGQIGKPGLEGPQGPPGPPGQQVGKGVNVTQMIFFNSTWKLQGLPGRSYEDFAEEILYEFQGLPGFPGEDFNTSLNQLVRLVIWEKWLENSDVEILPIDAYESGDFSPFYELDRGEDLK